jgi:hypothetical protein
MRTSKLLILCILFLAASSPCQDTRQTDPTERRVRIDPQTTTTINYVSALLQQAGLWGGIEDYRSDCSPDPEMRMPLLDGTVQDALTQLRGQDNAINWKVQGDGIVVSRRATKTWLLDTRIGDFTFYKRDHPEKSTDKLLNLPTVKEEMSRLNLALRPPEIGFAQPPIDTLPEGRVLLKEATFRDVLNAIARVDHPRVWLFRQTTCSGQTTLLIQWVVK